MQVWDISDSVCATSGKKVSGTMISAPSCFYDIELRNDDDDDDDSHKASSSDSSARCRTHLLGGCGKAADSWRKRECTNAVLGGPSSKVPFLRYFPADEHRRI